MLYKISAWSSIVALGKTILSLILTPGPIVTPSPIDTLGPNCNHQNKEYCFKVQIQEENQISHLLKYCLPLLLNEYLLKDLCTHQDTLCTHVYWTILMDVSIYIILSTTCSLINQPII